MSTRELAEDNSEFPSYPRRSCPATDHSAFWSALHTVAIYFGFSAVYDIKKQFKGESFGLGDEGRGSVFDNPFGACDDPRVFLPV